MYLTGKNCIACPTTLTKRYNVLDWFKVTHIWSERESVSSQKIRIKFRFEKLDTSRDGWWMPAPSSPETQPHGAVVEQTCEECKEASPHIYTCGWMCLNRGCKVFNLVSFSSFRQPQANNPRSTASSPPTPNSPTPPTSCTPATPGTPSSALPPTPSAPLPTPSSPPPATAPTSPVPPGKASAVPTAAVVPLASYGQVGVARPVSSGFLPQSPHWMQCACRIRINQFTRIGR